MKAHQTAQAKSGVTVVAAPTVEERISGTIMAVVFAGSALVGLWSVAAMVGGLIAAGGPAALAKGFAQAVLGV